MNLKKEPIAEKNKILETIETVILSTINKSGHPNASYAPVAVDKENNFFIYISDLSKHTQNILSNNNVSIMLIEDVSNSENVFARKRLTLNVKASLIKRDTKLWNTKINLLEKRFPDAFQYLKNLIDFNLFQLSPKDALLVYGFGKAFKFLGQKLELSNHLNDKGHIIQSKNKERNENEKI